DGEYPLLALFLEVRLELCPDRFRALRGAGKKFFIACIWDNIANDEIADIDRSAPIASPETRPAILILGFLLKSRAPFHGLSPVVGSFGLFYSGASHRARSSPSAMLGVPYLPTLI